MGSEAENKETQKRAQLAMMELSNMLSLPMSLRAVIHLNVPDAIWASGVNVPLSAAEILARLSPQPPPSASPVALQRILRLLSSYGLFSELHQPPNPRRYSLTEIGKYLVQSNGNNGSFAAYILQHYQEAFVRAWPLLHEAVLDPEGPEPIKRTNGGVGAYEYIGKNPEINELTQRGLRGVAGLVMEVFLNEYANGFGGVQTLVDVGGSSGACLRMIMDRFPGIQFGINFDLPEVVAEAPELPGVKHVAGNMFEAIPAGDAIFVKMVLVTCTNEECLKILKNCYTALPEGGKLIAYEPVLPEVTDDSPRTRILLEGNVFGIALYSIQGIMRTEQEFRQLGVLAGFSNLKALHVDYHSILEFHK